MKVVGVTGAEGFVGSHLVEHLIESGYRVRALVQYNSFGSVGWIEHLRENESLELIFGDIRDSRICQDFVRGLEVVYHLAALIAIPYSYKAPDSYLQVNVLGTNNILDACVQEGVPRVIHTSTSEVYGTAQFIPQSELHPVVGQSPYAASKIAADQIAYSYFASFGLNVTTLRPFNQFGPRQSLRAVLPSVILQALDGGPIEVGALNTSRDFSYVKQTANVFRELSLLDTVGGEVFNSGSGQSLTISTVVSDVMDFLGVELDIVVRESRLRPDNSEVLHLQADNSKLESILPSNAFNHAALWTSQLAETIEWYSSHRAEYPNALGRLQL